MSWHHLEIFHKSRSKRLGRKLQLIHTEDMPRMRDIPKAGPPWVLPPPLTEGQEIHFWFHDDLRINCFVTAVAVQIDGRLEWCELSRSDAPRAMVGTSALGMTPSEHLAHLTEARGRRVARARDRWFQDRLFAWFGPGYLKHNNPVAFRRFCADRKIHFRRRVSPDCEQLWVNGQLDSTFFPSGRKKESR